MLPVIRPLFARQLQQDLDDLAKAATLQEDRLQERQQRRVSASGVREGWSIPASMRRVRARPEPYVVLIRHWKVFSDPPPQTEPRALLRLVLEDLLEPPDELLQVLIAAPLALGARHKNRCTFSLFPDARAVGHGKDMRRWRTGRSIMRMIDEQ